MLPAWVIGFLSEGPGKHASCVGYRILDQKGRGSMLPAWVIGFLEGPGKHASCVGYRILGRAGEACFLCGL